MPSFPRRCALVALVVSVAHAACGGRVATSIPTDPFVDVTDSKSWLVQKVCADAHGVRPVDPYDPSTLYGDGGCPPGTTQRDLSPSDSLPYYRYSTLTGANGPSSSAISAPVWDAEGQELVMMQRSFSPDGTLSFDTNFSHFDTYRLGDDWISQYGTRDNGSFNETFFGLTRNMVTPYNGWTDFPATGFLDTAPVNVTDLTAGGSWELCGVSPPGAPPASTAAFNPAALQYQLLTAFPFGSVGGARKPMSTIAASHIGAPQPYPTNGDPDQGHTETWYFTVPYGPTRWEVWSTAECLFPHAENPNPPRCGSMPAGADAYIASGYCTCAPAPSALGDCNDGPTTQSINYMGTSTRAARTICRDWSNVVPVSTGAPVAVPYWPSPQANLLRNFHFSDARSTDATDFTLGWDVPASLAVASEQSTALYDTTRSGLGAPSGCATGTSIGVRYVTMTCAEAPCGALSQDIPLAAHPTVPTVMTSGTYAFGVTARTHPTTPNPPGAPVPTTPTGTLVVSLTQIDANGNVIPAAPVATAMGVVGPAVAMNVESSTSSKQDALIASVVLSSAYVAGTAVVQLDPRTTALRLGIAPQSAGVTFDLVDASVARVGPP